MLRCAAASRRKWGIKTISELRRRIKKIGTKFAVENVMCCAIAEWFETGHVSLEKYPEEFHDAILSQ